jgi:DNA-binding transcriptional MerR regulator
MFKIGDFSRISQVPVSALRYYDEVGLLRPANIDRFTGYRSYSASQLPRLNRILALKDLGFTLEQVARLLDEDLPTEQLRGMLRLKRAETEQRVSEERARLARVETRLKQIEEEGRMPGYEIVLKKVDPQTIASARGVVEQRRLSHFSGAVAAEGDLVRQIGDRCDELVGDLKGLLKRTGAKDLGPWMLIIEQRDDDIDLEMATPVNGASERSDAARSIRSQDNRVALRELPGAEKVASTVHQGSYETILQAYSALGTWIEDNGYQITGSCREIYVTGPQQPGGPVTEIQFPVEQA